ncbi:MAG: CehA/McbA family metallohydrolase [Sandaracinaceae bacterium]
MRCLLACLALLAVGCERGCFDGDEDCVVATPCAALAFECATPRVEVRVLEAGDAIPGGVDALAAPGDVILTNGVATAVIDAIDHPHYVAPTGGNLLDLTSATGDDDSLTHVFHAVGLLPEDSFSYERLTIDRGDGYAAVQVVGTLAGWPDVRVATRYEMRPCEPGIRVRTEMMHHGPEPRSWALVDAWYWSGREAVPFSPGRGFDQPGIIDPVHESWESQPWFAAAAHTTPSAAYVEIACDADALFGFHSEQITGVGRAPRIAQPRTTEVFERFIGVAPGRSIAPASDIAAEVRSQLLAERYVTLSGRVEGDGLGDEARATLLIDKDGRPFTQVTPDAEGNWSARVPSPGDYRVALLTFGTEADAAVAEVRGGDDVEAPSLSAPPTAELALSVTVDGVADHAQVFVWPADDATDDAVRVKLFESFTECAPLVGAPHGGSPACNRVLVDEPMTVRVPPGRYDVFATGGPFASVARQTVSVAEGETADVALAIERLDAMPAGTLSGDFHVHGGASFDSTIPDFDRVRAFLAANVDVIVATDHDVVWDYADARDALGADARMQILVGLETTGHVLFDLTPGNSIPQVIGHWNVWPLAFEPSGPYRGAPWDELVEPGALFDRFVEAGWPEADGVIQLNHPWAAAQFGRDLGFPRAVGVDAREPLPTEFDGTGQSMILRTPPGAGFGNADYHAQEVMNGTENEDLLPYRAYWFYLLSQGILRAGTANSDSHTLVDNVLGTPRTIVTTDTTLDAFDEVAFNAAIRAGRMTGTNGPVIEVSLEDDAGAARGPSLEAFTPMTGGALQIRVRAAAWVPVEEIRVVVNGRVARTLAAELTHPEDPLAAEVVTRFDGEIALSELSEPGRDAWIVVEAGAPLPLSGDLDCDGIPDTSDNDGDGVVDWRDVDRNDDDVVDASDADEIEGPPEACDPDQDLGPIGHTARPDRASREYLFWAVTPGGYPASFTNPLIVDVAGDGFDAPGLGGER